AAIAACFLYELYGDRSYLAKAQALFAWEKNTLVEPESGKVWDNIRTNGVIGHKCFSYNQGTFIGAANYLYKLTGTNAYYEAALQAARYAQTNLGYGGILPVYGGGDAAGFNGIFVRWMARFAKDQHLWSEFHPWLLQNAEIAWRVRRADNLSWHKWSTPTPDQVLNSWSCSDTVVILQVVPPKLP
ncbi:MAG TPA: glycoside hydrolase family 76 protein, partial [Candidatus Sulfotelmatobacter sp.]|nr:glycoside hydrolase family 76 protein [Candidatus Sulfotelmatobacter sp.]